MTLYRWVSTLAIATAVMHLSLADAYSEEGSISAQLRTSDGKPLSNVPVTVRGLTQEGEELTTFFVTDQAGNLNITDLPEGQYEAVPAWESEAAVEFSVSRQRWYRFWERDEAQQLGEFTVNLHSESLATRETAISR